MAENIKSVCISGTLVPAYPGSISESKDLSIPVNPPAPIPITPWVYWYDKSSAYSSGFKKEFILSALYPPSNPEYQTNTIPIAKTDSLQL